MPSPYALPPGPVHPTYRQQLDQAMWIIHRDIWWAALADWGGTIH
ncbi:MAG: hypothetical protein AB7N65_24060 [Vicinamibacterales bacterium]